MSRFIGYVRGSRGEASRLGTEKSGLRVKANGWGAGVQVVARAQGDSDEFYVWATGGSGGGGQDKLVAKVTFDADTGDIGIQTWPEGEKELG
jgi:hypothetical protein